MGEGEGEKREKGDMERERRPRRGKGGGERRGREGKGGRKAGHKGNCWDNSGTFLHGLNMTLKATFPWSRRNAFALRLKT